jgi:hypothetical protein
VQEEGDHPIIRLRIFGRVTRVALEANRLGPDDGGGGAGVREPRRPLPPLDDTAIDFPDPREVESVEPQYRRAPELPHCCRDDDARVGPCDGPAREGTSGACGSISSLPTAMAPESQ